MKKKIQDFTYRYIFNDALDLQNRLFNIVLVFCIFAEISACVIFTIEKTSVFTSCATAMMVALTVILFWLCNRFNLYKAGIRCAAVLVFDCLFPLVFFSNGGARSGITGYFVLSLVLSFFLFRGKECVIMCVIHSLIISGCYITGALFPQTITHFTRDLWMYVDIIHAILMSGILIGFLIKFQLRIYEIEKEKAVAASRAKAHFLANVSHEIRTPLNAVIGLGELELNKELPDDTRGNLEKMYDSSLVLLSIINDLLDISKIESGRFELIPADYQTASFINDTANLNMVRIGSKPINFQLSVDANLPSRLTGDELRIRQILNNLLSNAIKYTREGVVKLTVHAEFPEGRAPLSGEKIFLVCTVEDSGIGIKAENLEKIFMLYQQVDIQSNRHIEGTGLGLAICKNLSDLMGGTISARSEYGKGSVFTVRIPQQTADVRPLGIALAENIEQFHFNVKKRERRKNVRNPMPYGTVLVVDDVSINLEVARGMLLPYGITVECAKSGEEAVRLIREQTTRYDAIFMDHMMPGMDGITAVKIMRSEIDSDYARNVPVIALTANAILGNEKMFLSNGFQDYLSKPIDTSKLDLILNKWVRDPEKENSAQWNAAVGKLRGESAEKSEGAEAAPGGAQPVAGIDFAEGTRRMGNRQLMYKRVLASFAAGMPAMLEKIRHFSADALDEYRINVHGIKGASYGISANEMGREAEALETAAKNSDTETILANNAPFISRMETLVAEIAAYLKK